jgi:spore coat polysaccharide biosynthesis protein SpsF (cytidylyltransferase family)
MTSTRFPGKILQKIGEKTILQMVLDATKKAKKVDAVVIAAPHKIPGFKVFTPQRGTGENDVLSRIYQCAKLHKADVVVRITADCPLLDPYWIDFCVDVLRWGKYDFVCNTPYCPDGLDVEAYSMEALTRAFLEARDPKDREHCHPFIRRNGKIAEVSGVWNYGHIKLSVDTPEDLGRVRRVYGL